jgi:hypothetical protein
LRRGLPQVACVVTSLLLLSGLTRVYAQSEGEIPDIAQVENNSVGARASASGISQPIDFRTDFSASVPARSENPASATHTISEEPSSEVTAAPGADEADLPDAPIQVNLTPLLAHIAQNAQHSEAPTNLEGEEHYHWRGLLLQSFWFFGIEQTARLFTDPYYRYLTVDKPFWHDYVASLHQWNMGRWSDGDDFLVAYIGHPIQGAVTSYIEIQNDPHDRYLQFSNTRAYWLSRFKGMMWATVFSTDEKVGPLGETALGSEGGYTYIIGCDYGKCTYTPGVTKYTNNTGWVKFITTPVVGTVWVIGEDAIDRYITAPIEEAHPGRVAPKILRGSLNPCRTAANAMRLKKPWYRDYEHPETRNYVPVHFISEREMLVRRLPRFEIFPHFNALSLPINTSGCAPCRSWTTGAGVGFSYRFKNWLDFDSDLSHQPDASPLPSDRAGGSIISGTFGFRTGLQTPHYALKIALRPGFVSYDHAYLTSPTGIHLMGITGPVIIPPASATPETGRITHFVTALSINGDYAISRHLLLRGTFGMTAIRYKTDYYDRPPGRGSPPYIYFISPDIYATNENWNFQTGPVLRF